MHSANSYNETCANLCNAMFNYRMLSVKGESKYADIIERVMYNSGISGIDIAGENYFYTNPLRRSLDHHMGQTDYPTRVPYINCFCCPPNLVRTVAKLSGWAYCLSEKGIAVNLYGGNTLNTKLSDGSTIKLDQETNYPWDGKVTITVKKCKKEAFDMQLRIPEWAEGSTISVNGKTIDTPIKAGNFVIIERSWRKGDVVALDMPMQPKLVAGHRYIEETRNQVAITRGPVVYCIESPDLPENTDVLDVHIPSNITLIPNYEAETLGGITSLSGEVLLKEDREDAMYYSLKTPEWKTFDAKFVPYFYLE